MALKWHERAASSLLMAAQMLELEAEEWRSRKYPDHQGRSREQGLRIAQANDSAAEKFRKLALEAPEMIDA